MPREVWLVSWGYGRMWKTTGLACACLLYKVMWIVKQYMRQDGKV